MLAGLELGSGVLVGGEAGRVQRFNWRRGLSFEQRRTIVHLDEKESLRN